PARPPPGAGALPGAGGRETGAPAPFVVAGRRVDVALVGVGLAAAGATSGRWFAQRAPATALLVGLCGTFDRRRLPIGGLFEATTVACDGIGAGEAERF